ncbi:MAG: hypothetical protein QXS96_07340 [Candidatus Caldarchaeum sp.]
MSLTRLEKRSRLNFTGNWFVDIGILGFVNLMEEIYGWDLDKLEEEIAKSEERVYYGYYPFAYFSKLLLDKESSSKEEIRKKIEDLKHKLEQTLSSRSLNKEEMIKEVWHNFICRLYEDKWVSDKLTKLKNEKDKAKKKKLLEQLELESYFKKLNASKVEDTTTLENELRKLWKKNVIDNRNNDDLPPIYRLPVDSGFYKNFLFFNNSSNNSKQRDSLYNMISYSGEENAKDVLKNIDKTINKFLASTEDFPNIFYTNLESRILNIPFLFVYLLCFTHGFIRILNKNIVFYSNDIEFCYKVNKRLRLIQGDGDYRNDRILTRVWGSIIDVLIEHKSEWSLQNMYIISYERLDNQTQEGVEYIGIPKLQATILLDDKIREQLNKFIRTRDKRVWFIQEFIKEKPLYPYIQEYITEVAKSNNKKVFWGLLYALIVDAKVLELRADNHNKPFSNPSTNYRGITRDIKEEIRSVSYTIGLFKEIDDIERRKKIALELLGALETEDKNMYINILLNYLNTKKELCDNINLIRYIHEKIIYNIYSFRIYELALVMGLLMNKGESDE